MAGGRDKAAEVNRREGVLRSESECLEHIRRVLPDLDLRRARFNREGMVNVSVIVGEERVCRFPRDERGVGVQRREGRALDLARRHVDLPVPAWDYRSDEMVSYPFIPGDPLLSDDVARMGERERDAVAEELGVFMAQMHGIPPAEAEAAGVGDSEAGHASADYRRFYAEVEERLFPLMWADGREWVRRLYAPFLADPSLLEYEPRFINGDLATYHLLFDRGRRRLNGVIDFGTAGLGDPAQDLAIVINQYGEAFLRRMRRVCPHIERHIERARFFAGRIELEWVLRGLQNDDPGMFVVHLGRWRDVGRVGSGWE